MRTRNLIWCLLGAVVLTGTASAQANKALGTEQTVAAQEQKWLQSQRANNTDLLAPLLADNVVATNSEGKIFTGKAAVLADAKLVKWSNVDYTNVQVAAYGDTAIATGLFSGKGTDAKGKAVDVRERYTDTWVKMPDGRWQCVATQGSSVKM